MRNKKARTGDKIKLLERWNESGKIKELRKGNPPGFTGAAYMIYSFEKGVKFL